MRRRHSTIAIVAVVLLIAAVAWVVGRPYRQASSEPGAATVTLTPAEPDPAGLDPAGGLLLVSSRPLKAAAVQANLSAEPGVPLKVTQADRKGMRFAVAPTTALAPDRIYRFRLNEGAGLDRTYQWSFQTRKEFRLLGTLPAHQVTGVPVNTGIELVFSHEDYEDPASFFAISPEVKGRFERHKETAVFVPAEPLESGTVYTVTLKPGLRRTDGEGKLAAERSFSFETAFPETDDLERAIRFASEMAEFPTGTAPYFALWSRSESLPALEVEAFRYPDAQAFVAALREAETVPWWASGSRDRYREPAKGLAPAVSFTSEAERYGNGTYLVFPEPLPPGYYLANVKIGEEERQVRFQVTDLSYYLAETTNGILVWLNDLNQGRPAAGAEVAYPDGSARSTAGADGVAVVKPLPAKEGDGGQAAHAGKGADAGILERPPLLLIARSGPQEAVIYSQAQPYWGGTLDAPAAHYWRYLYLDRSLYKPQDTVQFWGIVHPREPEADPVSEVRVEIYRHDYRSYDGGSISLAGTALPVTNSSFIGSLALPSLAPGFYEAQLSVEGQPFASHWFEVAAYAKPAYQLEISADRAAVFTGEPITFRVKASFFEGTPVPHTKLNYRFDQGTDEGGSLTTDENGEATLTYTPPHHPDVRWGYEDRLTLYVTAGEPEVGEVSAERQVRLFRRDVMTVSKVSQQDEEATVTVQLNRITLDRINAGQGDHGRGPEQQGPDHRGPALSGATVEFALIEQHWNRVEEGQYYDFIAKVSRPQYSYQEDHRQIETAAVVTDPSGQASFTFAPDPEKQYEVHYRVQDSRGLHTEGSSYVSGRRFIYPESDGWGWTQLLPEDLGQGLVGIGEPVRFVLQRGQNRLADRTDGFLFFTARRGLQEHHLQSSAAFPVVMKAGDPPNLALVGVHFDGRGYVSARRTVRFDAERRRLTVAVTPDKEAYRPGEEVRVQVAVQDREGNPAAGAVVNLNLVDEALFALRDQRVDTLASLYGDWVDPGILRTQSSHEEPPTGGGAEKGGEGPGVRRDFRDAVLFTSVLTDGAGRASAAFRVPDNLTSWRLTYQAVRTDTMEAGNGSIGIPVTLPFFADLVMGDAFLVGEQPVLQVRAYGAALTGSERVNYQVTVEGPSGYRQTMQVSSQPFEAAAVPLAKLEAEGQYTVRVTASGGAALSDALERSFTVSATRLRQNHVAFTPLEPGSRLEGAPEGLTTLTFLDWERGRYLDLLQRMRWQWGNRFEMKLARAEAAALLKAHFAWEELWPEPELETVRYQTQEGAIAILPYSDGDLKLSALAADLAPERFDQVALSLHFQRVLEDEGESRERQILALYGLAALNQPVLTDAHALLDEADLTPVERLYGMLAVAELGDLETVRPLYRDLVGEYGEEIGRDLRLTLGSDRDEQLEATALAAALAGKLGEPETARLISYLVENRPDESLVELELLLAAKSGLAGLSGEPVSFRYRLGDQAVTRELKPGERVQLALRPEELASLVIEEVQGSVAAVASYTTAGKPAVEMDGGTVERHYSPEPEEWQPGDIVTVLLDYSLPADAPEGDYELTDALPSGLRYVERPWQYGQEQPTHIHWPLQVDGQRVTFWAHREERPISYVARVIAAGQYRAEEAVLQHQKSGLVYGMESAEAVRIEW